MRARPKGSELINSNQIIFNRAAAGDCLPTYRFSLRARAPLYSRKQSRRLCACACACACVPTLSGHQGIVNLMHTRIQISLTDAAMPRTA